MKYTILTVKHGRHFTNLNVTNAWPIIFSWFPLETTELFYFCPTWWSSFNFGVNRNMKKINLCFMKWFQNSFVYVIIFWRNEVLFLAVFCCMNVEERCSVSMGQLVWAMVILNMFFSPWTQIVFVCWQFYRINMYESFI